MKFRLKPVSLRALASEICLAEGRKHSASIGDVREILRLTFERLGEAVNAGDSVRVMAMLQGYAAKQSVKRGAKRRKL